MSSYPNRCQHIKINGTQCGSPALRRNKFCFFHKKWHEQRILINARHARRVRSIDLPVLEDANSIQVALMQVMRMTMSGELDNQKAGLLLYALQTASCNLRHTNFEPLMHDVVLDPRDAADTVLGQSQLWCDEDFEEEEDEAAEDQEDASDFAVNDIQAVSSPHARKTPRRADLVVARKVAGSANSRRESWSGRLDLNQRPPAPKYGSHEHSTTYTANYGRPRSVTDSCATALSIIVATLCNTPWGWVVGTKLGTIKESPGHPPAPKQGWGGCFRRQNAGCEDSPDC
jgi:hypothetical protein